MLPFPFNPDIHHRRSIRLSGYDYARAGAYFVTVCSQNRECVFGEVVDGSIQLSEWGRIIRGEWLRTRSVRSNVQLDAFIVMPNHFHGIVVINGYVRGTARRAPTMERFGQPVSGSLPTIIRAFKSATTKRINQLRGTPSMRVWQRNYYEHVVRNENDLIKIRQYIERNPIRWEDDKNHPENIGSLSRSI